MVFRVKTNDLAAMAARAARLEERLTKKFPEYASLLQDGNSQMEADRLLLENGKITENELLNLYCDEMHIDPFNEQLFELPAKIDDFSGEYLAGHVLLPLAMDEKTLRVAVAAPYLLEQECYVLEQFFGRSVEFELGRRGTLERLINRCYLENKEEVSAGTDAPSDENELRRLAGENGIVKLVNDLFTQALGLGVSDIHIEPEEDSLMIRFRIDGILNDYLKLPISDYSAIASRIKLIGGLNIAERRLPQDGRTNFQLGNRDLDIRISTIPIMNGESIVLRLLSKDVTRFDLRELGMSDQLLPRFERLVSAPHGIILVVGPTGSGKTTTLYSVMRQLNDRHRKIITIEDPVEYQLPGLSQMQVNPKIGLNFSSGLRHIVRQDPDVILVGEIRDRETADIAINAALTGHLVLSTLHTNDAVGAIVRLLDMKVEPFLITASLCGVLSQRLVRLNCSVCKGTGKDAKSGERCRNCSGTGFRGRSGIFELLVMDDDVRDAIQRGASNDEIEALARAHGMKTLFEDGQERVKRGETTQAELLRSASGLLEGEVSQ